MNICSADSFFCVTNSSLCEGKGLAAGFVSDRNISSHPDVIFADDFEEGDLPGKWDSMNKKEDRILDFVDESEVLTGLGHRSLRVTAVLGKNNGGGLTKWFDSANTLFFRFYVKFDADCDYVHHFCTLRANRGLTGGDKWTGFGGAGDKPDGTRRFSTALEPWGNWARWPTPGRWNFYSYWHEMEISRDGKYWGNSFLPENQPDIVRNQWICAEFMLKHNTPEKPDGEQAFWIDGRLRGHWGGINWRTDPILKANAFTLESYITDRWTKHPTNIVYFDNVAIARSYIGPMGSP